LAVGGAALARRFFGSKIRPATCGAAKCTPAPASWYSLLVVPQICRAERNKRPGVSYAVTNDGVELPVLDVTHPAFSCELSELEQAAMLSRFLDEQRRFARLPRWLRAALVRFALRGSRIARGLRRAEHGYLDSMTTYLFKLGPKNLGSYAVPVDRKILRTLPAISVRLRAADMARLLADGLVPRLSADASRPLYLVNIAGGPASDSLNALILLRREWPQLLAARPIMLDVLDRDRDGPAFGGRALAALQEAAAPLHGLSVRFEHRPYDWRDPSGLADTLRLANASRAVVAVSSEGGLFEYGTDRDVVENLRVLGGGGEDALFVVGSVTRDDEAMRTLKLTSTIATKPRGLAAFSALVEAAGFGVARSIARPFSDQVLLVPQAHGFGPTRPDS
jgi:hypothetical protein